MSSTMLSSAVVIPKQPPTNDQPPSPSLKRRQSSQSFDGNKRPRLDSTNINGSHGSPPPPSPMSPPRRKSSLMTGTEEKKRGQRLFGSLLGTLSQTSSKPAHKKRDEIEKRQQERLKRDDGEREDEKRRKREELERVRRDEQKAWDKEGVKMRHRNMRATAGFLRTKTEPRLYFKPWELRPEEEERIKRQVEEVNAEIREEEQPRNDRKSTIDEDVETKAEIKEEPLSSQEATATLNRTDPRDEGVKIEPEVHEQSKKPEIDLEQQDIAQSPRPETNPELPSDERSKEDDHGGEELVEGHEDDVIY